MNAALVGIFSAGQHPDSGDELNAASPSSPTRPLDQRSITTWATWSR
jgi:hypothetical protein